MSTRRSGRVPADERSVVSTVRGLPAWSAVLLAVAVTLTGVAIDSLSGGLGTGFTVGYFLGCLIAVLAVSRRALFVAGIQPPLIMSVLVPMASVIAGAGLTAAAFSRSQMISLVLPLATRFPLMLTTTLVVVAIALIRAFVLEPRSPRPVAVRRQRAAPAHARR
ncbi:MULTISPECIES: DUF6542 domain-containing protein [Dietzia]|uniref:DUF6542 domain-containing protein n=3 Tax=Dietziaceae TaxID=85029 RepID=UPI0015CDD806|nr:MULTISPECIES: DUF6542 domain-containing protein [Dietzia]MBB1033231.1 hypothetical protein [Dietzia sp. CQ4]MBB1036875.1 hypothetical protein [Dietzia natronolimnaea]MBB1039901.1 hypothetical protein [Dietzia sp. Cai40]MBB1051132.1 hypothetical protein [Dietzia sp. CW19]MBB1053205.1 hypothetical protein [Dietzia sp. B44]